jgi:phage terminase small subunit
MFGMGRRVALAQKELVPAAAKAVGALERNPEWRSRLTARELRFVEEYLVDCNPSLAAQRAGLGSTPSSCAKAGTALCKQPTVCRAIWEASQSVLGDSLKASVLHELAAIAFANAADYYEFDGETVRLKDSAKLTRHQMAAVKAIKQSSDSIEVQLHDKQAALGMLMKLLSMEVKGNPGVAIQINFSAHDKAVL